MNSYPKFWVWVKANAEQDVSRLTLSCAGKEFPFDVRQAILQIQARQKFGKKLAHTLSDFPHFYFPSMLSGEQSTSDLLASYHAGLIRVGASVVDLTAGLGIDAMHFAANASSVMAVEQNPLLTDALKYNAEGLGVSNLEAINSTCEDFIAECIKDGRRFDYAFIDPARRGEQGQRLFALKDCAPDVITLMPEISKIADTLIIKASPMLDISGIISELPTEPSTVIALGTPTECKELIAVVNFHSEPQIPKIQAVTLPDCEDVEFTFEEERACPMPEVCKQPMQGAYICEPYPAVMKAGVFRLLAERYGLQMFTPNTRVLYSGSEPESFPGNSYRIEKVLPYASKVIKRFAREYPRINVAARNFGMSADALRSKLGVADGGNLRLYAVTDSRNERILIVTSPAKS